MTAMVNVPYSIHQTFLSTFITSFSTCLFVLKPEEFPNWRLDMTWKVIPRGKSLQSYNQSIARLTIVFMHLPFDGLNVSTVQGVLLIDYKEVHGHEHRWPKLIMIFYRQGYAFLVYVDVGIVLYFCLQYNTIPSR